MTIWTAALAAIQARVVGNVLQIDADGNGVAEVFIRLGLTSAGDLSTSDFFRAGLGRVCDTGRAGHCLSRIK
jgi:hypothetical protein